MENWKSDSLKTLNIGFVVLSVRIPTRCCEASDREAVAVLAKHVSGRQIRGCGGAFLEHYWAGLSVSDDRFDTVIRLREWHLSR